MYFWSSSYDKYILVKHLFWTDLRAVILLDILVLNILFYALSVSQWISGDRMRS